jgi:hypothetical protein
LPDDRTARLAIQDVGFAGSGNGGALTKTGTGTLTLSGVDTYTEMAERLLGRRHLRGEFSDVTASYAGEGVVRYAW